MPHTSLPTNVMKRQFNLVLQDIKKKTIDDVTERHGKSLHDSEDNIVFKLIKKFPTELSFRKCEERKQRPNDDS